jgi:membrane associated rhomboid family serine protease
LRVEGSDKNGPALTGPSTLNSQPSTTLWVTPAIAVVCTLLWALTLAFDSPDTWRPFLLRPATFSPLSMFTAQFIHLYPFHLGTNLVLLGLFGPLLERRLGAGPFSLLYLGAGLLAALLHLAISLLFRVGEEQYASGASGALFGLMGAFTVLYAEGVPPRGAGTGRGWSSRTGSGWLLVLVVAFIFYELLQGSWKLLQGREDVAHWAHIGGFLFGLIITVAMGQGAWAADQLLADGQLLLRRGQYSEAERVLERAWSLQPHDPATILCLARAKQALGSGETARELLAGALEQEVRDGHADRAVALYLEARTLAPRLRLSDEAFYRIGGWLVERGLWAEACAALERVGAAQSAVAARQASEPVDRSAHSEAGAGTPAPGAVPAASRHAPRKEDPLVATALFRAAELALTRLEQPERAAALLERLLREQPNSQWRALAERSLRQLRG